MVGRVLILQNLKICLHKLRCCFCKENREGRVGAVTQLRGGAGLCTLTICVPFFGNFIMKVLLSTKEHEFFNALKRPKMRF